MKTQWLFLQIILYIFFFLVVACSSNQLSQETTKIALVSTATTTISIPSLAQPTHTLKATETPQATLLPTLTPMPTSTFTVTSTLTPFPTLPFEEAETVILNLLQDNDDCRLPCWWGAVPGKSTWREFEPLLVTLSADIVQLGDQSAESPLGSYEFSVGFLKHPMFSKNLWSIYTVNQDVIESIEVGSSLPQNYLLSQILTMYGQPDEIWVVTYNNTPDDTHPFRMTLVYWQHSFSVSYEIQSIQTEGDNLIACPQQPDRTFLWLVSPNRDIKFSDVEEETLQVSEEPYRRLEEVTNLTIESFYETFKNANYNDCFKTPRTLWDY